MIPFLLAALLAAASYTARAAVLSRTSGPSPRSNRLLSLAIGLAALAAATLIAVLAATTAPTALGFVTGGAVISLAHRSRVRRHRPGH